MFLSLLIISCTQSTPSAPGELPSDTGASSAAVEQDSAEAEQAPEEDEPSLYIYEDTGGGGEALLSERQITDGIEGALEDFFSIQPQVALDSYQSMLAGQDADCPSYQDDYYSSYGYYYWNDTCTSQEGSQFSGYASFYDYRDWPEDARVYDIKAYLSGALKVEDKDGRVLDLSGTVSHYSYLEGGTQVIYSYLSGEFREEGGSASWMERALSLNLYLYTVRYGDYDPPGYTTTLYGSMATERAGLTAVEFEDVFFLSEHLGGSCELEPSGVFSLRDDEGRWYDVEFQGPRYWGAITFPLDCDGCGDIWHRGEKIGEACPSFQRLHQWSQSPW